ncbi:T9SS type A sorting domain-containing protein [Flavobacterium sp. 3-210]
MKKKLLLFIMLLCSFFIEQKINAQVNAGDIAFIGYQTGAPAQDGFTFITLKAIPAGTTIYFTDRGWNRTTSTWVTGSTEMHLQWNVPGTVPAGTIVSVIETTTADQLTVTGTTGLGFASGFIGFNLSAGDQMLAYLSPAGALPVSPNAPTFIAGIHADYNSGDYDPVTTWNTDNTSGGPSSALPLGLTNGVNCISLYPGVTEKANARYTGTLTGTSADLLASINNIANWDKFDGVDLGITPSGYVTPNVSTAVLATVSSAGASNIKAVSATLGGSVSADGGDSSVVRGIVWSTSANPVVTANTTVPIGSGTGTFSATITGLPAATTIHFRAYATNSAGTSYGNDLTFTTGAALTAPTPSKTDITCNGGTTGSATVAPTGGTTPYTYSWSPSGGSGATANNLSAGNYTVTVTDAESTQITRNVTINQPNVLSGIVSKVSVSCNGGTDGSATVTPSGGTTPYTYLWSNGVITATASNLVGGTYSVTITDANSCTKTINNIVIDQPPVLSGTASTTSVSCFGGANGTATVTASGGTPGYTYAWSPSGGTAATANGLSAGTYSVTITDANSCSTTVSNIVVGGPTNALIASAGAQTNILCNGSATGSATVNVTGGTGAYTYSWSPSGGTAATATGLTAGTYTVTVTDANSCQATESFNIIQPTALNATPVAQTNIACYGEATGSATISASGGTGPYTYSWSPSGGTAATATGLAAGTYTVTVTDANLCQATQSFTIAQPAASLSATTATVGVSCFGGSNGSASVTVSGGTPGYTYLWAPLGGTASSITGRPAGSYTCTITDANGCTLVKNLTILTPPILSTTITKTDVSCNGGTNGTATVSVTGGVGGYTYSWSPTGGNAATASGLVAGTYTVTITDANMCQVTQSVTINQPALLTATQSQTNVLCNGGATGTATVNVTGGTGTYTYLWSPSGGTAATASGLTVGNYSCLVTDANGCSITKNFTIVQPPVLSATTSQINATCSTGGQAAVSVSGGTTPYTYLWSPSGATTSIVTGLSAGNYSVLITDANGCTLTKNFVVTSTNTLVATTSQTNILCNGSATGSAYVLPSGAPGPFTYVWSPSGGNTDTASNLSAGNYSVTITSSNGCSIVKNFTITEPSALVVTPNSQTNVSCNGGANGSASVIVTGGTGSYTYLWAPSGGTAATASGLAAGTYTVTVKDANLCTKTQSFTITEPNALIATTTQVNVSCNGGSNGSATVNVTGGTAPYTYTWSSAGGTAATATGLLAGTYTVTVKDANLCQTTASVTITQPTTLTATTSKTNVTCNGSNDGTATVNVTGGTGAYTYSWSPSGGTAAIASSLAPGTYVVTVTDANLCQTTASVTITEPTLLTSTVTSTNISCNGANNGSATVTTTGGTGTYTYLWSPSGGTAATTTGLAPGNYSVKVTDANLCETLTTVIITEPAALVATASQINVSCNGGSNGSATVNVTGGTAPYTYAWSPSGGTAATASGLTAGAYVVTITDANACQTTVNVVITQPALLTATTSKTDISCNGANDGTATVNATGGTGAYTYSWAPSGGTSATATGLSPNTYTVTITDANGCFITKTINIITTPDVTAPLPNVASLPMITNYCSVLTSEIAIPTATDNCAGVINGTTTDPLTYNVVGTYVITWKYADASGNSTTQTQTVKVLDSPISAVTLSNAEFTYDGNPHSLQVANLPTGATVTYSANNISTNAGTYAVTATITPSASSPNCSTIVLTANLVIKKASQQITFGAIPVKTLGANNNFNLVATSSAGLPITFTSTYSSALPPATVSATGAVTMLRSGQVLITAQQAGNSNYLPATDVSQLLVILNNNIDIKSITIGSKVFENPGKTINYLLPCGDNNPTVSIVNESNATITPSLNFTLQTPKPGIYTQNATITSEDGSTSATYSITVEKPFGFYDIVHQKFNNVLLVNNNPQTNGGYEFVSYQWFKNGQLVGTGQYYSAGNDTSSTLDANADYMVKMTTKDGKVLQTCSTKIKLTNSLQAKLYPNPVEVGKMLTVEADFPQEEVEKMQISLYSVTGKLIKTVQSSTVVTEIQLPETTESNMYLVVLETPNSKKSFKVIVK